MDEISVVNVVAGRVTERVIYVLQEGEICRAFNNVFVVCHPDREPKIVRPDGTIEYVRPEGSTNG